jgi:chromosomal replication initiation ATPase DnaA
MDPQIQQNGGRKPVKKKSGVRARFKLASHDAHNAIDAFENFLKTKSREQVYAASVAVAITLVIFLTALYCGNYLVVLLVIAVWITT